MNNSATEMLVAACIEFLQAYPPFDRMEAEALRFLAEHVRLAHYPKGALILSSEMGVAPVLYILQRGKVRVRCICTPTIPTSTASSTPSGRTPTRRSVSRRCHWVW